MVHFFLPNPAPIYVSTWLRTESCQHLKLCSPATSLLLVFLTPNTLPVVVFLSPVLRVCPKRSLAGISLRVQKKQKTHINFTNSFDFGTMLETCTLKFDPPIPLGIWGFLGHRAPPLARGTRPDPSQRNQQCGRTKLQLIAIILSFE